MKRKDYISWDEYFMGVALLAARRSKDPNTQVGACIVSGDNIILSTGYNGFPAGCSDDEYPWEREGESTKYPFVVHAELNAILNAGGRSLRGARIYLSDKYADTDATRASKRMLASAGVTLRRLEQHTDRIVLDFHS